jgi:hypothetical protein
MVCAGFVLAVGVSVVMGDEFFAAIREVKDGKVTFAKFNKAEKKAEDPMTLPAAANVKVMTGKFNKDTKKIEAGEELAGGLKNEKFSNIGEKGVMANITTSDDGKTITEIRVLPKFGKKKKDN